MDGWELDVCGWCWGIPLIIVAVSIQGEAYLRSCL